MHRVVKRGSAFFIVDDHGKGPSRGFALRKDAEEALGALLRSSQRTIRVCMSCGRPFESEGSHNRLCYKCKRGSHAG